MVGSNKNNNPLDFQIREVQIKEIKEFTYLGCRITQNGRCKC